MSSISAFPSAAASKHTEKTALKINLCDSSRDLHQVGTSQVGYVFLEIRPPDTANVDEDALPLNLAIVIDRSTSMEGERLDKVKNAAALLLEKMSSRDHLSIITYSDRADVIVEAGPVINKIAIESKIRTIRASGGTEILQGMLAGMKQLARASLDKFISHLILLTDGHTYGDDQDCLTLAAKAADKGIGISAFGIGSEWNDDFLDHLVIPSGGQSGFIENPEQIIHFLRQRIQHLGVVYAQNVRLSLELSPPVSLQDAFKVTPYAQPIDIHQQPLNLGAVEGDQPLSILLELVIDSAEELEKYRFPLTIQAKIPSQEQQEITFLQSHTLIFDNKDVILKRSEKLLEAVRLSNLYQMNEKIWRDVEQGNTEAATRRLAHLTKRLEEAGFNDLARTALAETIKLENGAALSTERRMQLKYGTRMRLASSLTQLLQKEQESDEMGLETNRS